MGHPNELRRKDPHKSKIKMYWSDKDEVLSKFEDTDHYFADDYCFACVKGSKTTRAHILARIKGGLDVVENYHLLCHQCHKASEYLDGDIYWKWFNERTYADASMQAIMNMGYNMSAILSGKYDIELYRNLVGQMTDRFDLPVEINDELVVKCLAFIRSGLKEFPYTAAPA